MTNNYFKAILDAAFQNNSDEVIRLTTYFEHEVLKFDNYHRNQGTSHSRSVTFAINKILNMEPK